MKQNSGQKKQRTIDNWLLPTQMTTLLLELLEQQGVDKKLILKDIGINQVDLEDESQWISYRQAMLIIDKAYHYSEDSGLGLKVGRAADISVMGILGYAMLSSDTLKEALEIGIKYSRTSQNLSDIHIVWSTDQLEIHSTPPFTVTTEQHHFIVEELFSLCMSLIHELTGRHVNPLMLNCTYSKPSHHHDYESIFNCPINFNADSTCIIFSRNISEIPIRQANKFNASMAEKLCQSIIAERVGNQGVSETVRQLLIMQLTYYSNEAFLAEKLNISSRQLRRKLNAEGTNFRSIIDDVRLELAQRYLQHDGLSIEKIAITLGYTEATNFRRAFKRWTGVSPKQYRNEYNKQ